MIEFLPALPDIFVALSGLALLLLGAIRGDRSLPFVSVLTALCLAVAVFLLGCAPRMGLVFSSMFVLDGLAVYAKILILVAAVASLALAPSYLGSVRSSKPEYAALVLFAALGMMLMVSARDLIVVYAGLELQNLALYVLASFRRDDQRSSEAGLKYFVLGAFSSALLLFGLSYVYGAGGGAGFDVVGAASGPAYALGVAFTLAGFAFKISAAPFHLWAPDVYEGAPTPVTGFFLVAPKVAGLVLLVRLLAGPFAAAQDVWRPIVLFFAVASMVVGAFGGLAQTNVKRLMAYSAITNIGVMTIGLVLLGHGAAATAGVAGMLLYLALYFIGTFALFAALLSVRARGKPIEDIKDLSGLFKTHAGSAACLGAALFSLAGIPPLAGFFGKYNILLAAVRGGELWLAVVGVLASVVAAAYYLRIVKVMAFDPPPKESVDIIPDRTLSFAAIVAALSVSLFAVLPAPLMNAAQRAAESLLAP